MTRYLRVVVGCVAVLGVAVAWPAAQAAQPAAQAEVKTASNGKKILSVDDYTKWRSIGGEALSPDGKWLTYGLQFTNTAPADAKPILHIRNLETNLDTEVPHGSVAVFSDDSRWIAYIVDPTAGQGRGGRGRAGGAPAAGEEGRGQNRPAEPRRAEVRNLATGDVKTWQDIQTFSFSDSSTHLLLRRRPAETAGGRAGGGGGGNAGGGGQASESNEPAADAPRGVDVLLHDLSTGRTQYLGNVGDASFNKAGDLLAYTVDAAVRDANGLFVMNLATGRTYPLDNDAKQYSRLTWSDDGKALAVLKGASVPKMREKANALVTYRDVRAALDGGESATAVVLDPASATGFPSEWVVSERGTLEWSADNARVFFGAKDQAPAPETGRRRGTDEAPDVDVWNTTDERIQSLQMRQAEADRNRTYRQAFDVAGARFIKLADETMRDLAVAPEGKWAVGRDERGYVRDYGRDHADLYRVDTTTGARTLIIKGQSLGGDLFGFSPDGRQFLYWRDAKYHAYDMEAGSSRALGRNAADFTNMEFDRPGPKPAYGLTAFTTDGTAAIVAHRYDLWSLPLDGSAPRNLTGGRGTRDEVRFRYVQTAPDDDAPGGGGRGGRGGGAPQKIDLTKPITLSAYGEYTKKAGFYELSGGQLREIVYEDASFETPRKAKDADKYLFTRQTFVEFPDLRISGPDFKTSEKVTDVNPQQAEFNWGRRILFDYKNRDGLRLQGILALPDDYQPGEKRPMIVTFYEKNSQNLHRYSAPSYLTGMGASPIEAVSRGYITMLPDIHFRTGSSHTDMLECVEAAVKKVIEMGYVDPTKIGVSGHSYGGEGAAFIGTRSKMFAAVGMGAGVTDLTADFNQSWGWSYQVNGGSGANGHDYYLFGQGRWGFAPWDNPEVYRFESAITHVKDVVAPFLIMHGTADPTVSFSEGMNFYNALRYYNKAAVMLAYPNEGHGLRGMANRKDLTVRYFEFFDHYLKGAPAPKWLTEGIPYLEKAQGGGR